MAFTGGEVLLGDAFAADAAFAGAADAVAAGGLAAGADAAGAAAFTAGLGGADLAAGALASAGGDAAITAGLGGTDLAQGALASGAPAAATLDIPGDAAMTAGLSGANALTNAAGIGADAALPTLSTAGINPGAAAKAGVDAATVGGAGFPGTGAGPGALGGFQDFLKANKSLILPGALEAGALASKPKMPAYAGNLQSLAQPSAGGKAAGDLAASLIPIVQTGNLPPGAQTAVSNATNDAITSIKAKYAQMGMSGSSAEAQDISSAQARGQAMSFDLANQLTQTGLQAAGVNQQDLGNQENIYALLMNEQIQNDQQLQQALAGFASASALGAGLGARA